MRRLDLGPAEIDALLPQRAPFRFLDRVHALDPDPPFLHGSLSLTGDEPILAGHFPGLPIWPGACTLEGLAQSCRALESLLATGAAPADGFPVIARVDVTLPAPVRPPCRLDYRVWRESERGGARTWRVEAAVGARVVARGRLTGGRLVVEEG